MASGTSDEFDFDDFEDFDDEPVSGAKRSKPGEGVGVTLELAERDGEPCAAIEIHGRGESL